MRRPEPQKDEAPSKKKKKKTKKNEDRPTTLTPPSECNAPIPQQLRLPPPIGDSSPVPTPQKSPPSPPPPKLDPSPVPEQEPETPPCFPIPFSSNYPREAINYDLAYVKAPKKDLKTKKKELRKKFWT